MIVSRLISWAGTLSLLFHTTTTAFVPTHKSSTRRFNMVANGADSSKITKFPKLIVLDLDNTIWTPELYQLRKLQRMNRFPTAGKDVQLMKGAVHLLEKIRSGDFFPPSTKFAVASRTKSVEWAQDLLDQFQLRELLDYVEIFPGNKKQHFQNIQRDSGIPFSEMLFFDDARDGKYGNCQPVSEMGVLTVHCPTGLDQTSVWEKALQRYQQWDKTPNTIVEWDGSVSNSNTNNNQLSADHLQEGTVKTVNPEKRFGFITPTGRKGDVFFHFSALPANLPSVQKGDKLHFTILKDPKNGKPRAANIQAAGSTSSNANTISMRAFSMNMPFAALLANGYKTLESRNGTMFEPYPEGTQMLLHVGRRIYPDGDKHTEILRDAGLNDDEIAKLKSLPPNFGTGMLVAIMTIGKTYETTTAERSTPEMQRKICAYGPDSGRRLTEIKHVEYLKQPVPIAAQGGVFHVKIDPTVLPDGWELPPGVQPPEASKLVDSGKSGTSSSLENGSNKKASVYSISG